MGVACADDGNACTSDDTCDAGGVCQPGAACAPCLTCVPDFGCTEVTPVDVGCDEPIAPGSPLALQPGASDARDTVSWKLTRGPATTPTAFGDPATTTDYTLCVHGRPDEFVSFPFYADVLLSTVLPGGATCADGRPCWKSVRAGRRYRDRAGLRGGVTHLDLRAGDAGRTRLSLKAKGAALALPALPIEGSVLVRLTADGGRCWQAEYTAPRRNDATSFRAKGAAVATP